MLVDLKCAECGNEEKDILVKSSEEIVNCKICNTIMIRIFNGSRYNFKIESHTKIPPSVIGGGNRANFGRMPKG